MSRIVTPCVLRALTISQTSARLVGSKPVVGSSRKSTGGRPTRLRCQVKAPAHPTRVALCQPATSIGQVELFEQLLGTQAGCAPPHAGQLPDHHEVLEPGEQPVQGHVLSRYADALANLSRLAADVATGDSRPSRVGYRTCCQDTHGRRLARTVRAEDREDAALGHRQVKAGQCLDRP